MKYSLTVDLIDFLTILVLFPVFVMRAVAMYHPWLELELRTWRG